MLSALDGARDQKTDLVRGLVRVANDPEAVLGDERECDAAFASELHARSDTFVALSVHEGIE
jgi:hypothetical protein